MNMMKKPNRKSIEKKLGKMGYMLIPKITGWMVRSTLTGDTWIFKDLNGVRRFTVDEEAIYTMRVS
jgi:hypothetical protein